MKTCVKFFCALSLAVIFSSSASASVERTPSSRPVVLNLMEGVHEANDRDYYPALRHLIASAKSTIDVSLEAAAVSPEPGDPVQAVLNDLIDASLRGVKVRIFMNTGITPGQDLSFFLREDLLASLQKEKIEVHYVSPSYVLQDRLMIVDNQWVLEGGLPWTREDFSKSLGSATISRSEELANRKRVRLELLPLWDVEAKKQDLKDGSLPVPVYLMRDLKYIPGMVSAEDSDALKIYLALLKHFFIANQVRLTIPVEDLVSEIPADQHFAAAEASFQVYKALERLEKTHELIRIEQKGPQRVELTMVLPQDFQPSVRVPMAFFSEGYAKQFSANAIFAYLVIRQKSQISGDSPVWLGSEKNVEQDFPFSRERFRLGVEELKRKNLIEVFPFKLQDKYSRLENLEYRYVLNPVTMLSEKLEIWTRLRDEYGDSGFKRAQEIAQSLGEDEDPKVIAASLDLMKIYRPQDILSMAQHVMSLPENGTPGRLVYLRQLLEHEIPDAAPAVS